MSAASTSVTSSSARSSSQIVTSIGGVLTTITATATTVPVSGGIQSSASSSDFPHWAIIVVVLGIVAVVAICGLMLFAIFYLRERDKHDRRHPIRSRSPSPSMAEAQGEPVVAAAAGGHARDTSATSHGHRSNAHEGTMSAAQRLGAVSPDSTHSRTEPRPFSGSDAAIMANAFRAELRQPGRPLELDEAEGDGDGVTEARARSPERPTRSGRRCCGASWGARARTFGAWTRCAASGSSPARATSARPPAAIFPSESDGVLEPCCPLTPYTNYEK
ncbi:hypothetical protein B0H13DRAFT_745423 [Mycena leptocephala]|nr:hypothetical protein B0H13DRAFT_745423 [Mycena leptocephala]